MHSNNNCAFFFLFFFFVFIILTDGSNKLRIDYYDSSCRDLQKIVWEGVFNATSFNARMPASLLRLHFHDCFVLGCDASLLLDGNKGEKFAGPNLNSILGVEVIDNIKAAVETQCPDTVSCADILALVARAAVLQSLGMGKFDVSYFPSSLNWDLPLGRLDGFNFNQTGANNEIPAPTDPVDTLIEKFGAKGLGIKEMVALSGGHTIGMAKCSTFRNRLYFANTTNNVNPKSLRLLKQTCHNNNKTDNQTVFLDQNTKFIFDNKYFGNIINKAAVLESDQALGSDGRTSGFVVAYNKDQDSFFKDFVAAMVKMGQIGVITNSKNGEIRKTCGTRKNKNHK